MTDTYKLGHQLQYAPGITEVYSYLEARKVDKKTGEPLPMVFFGLQYYLKEYLARRITKRDAAGFYLIYQELLGTVPEEIISNIDSLVELGYWPIEICAVKEGTYIPSQNVLLTVRNTLPEFFWCVGFLESLLLKVWNPCTVATKSLLYKELVERFSGLTSDNDIHIPYAVHDFGYRGVSSEETAAISGASHLLNFLGSDTVPAVDFLIQYYQPEDGTPIAKSVPASEHSVMCSYGRENEFEAFDMIIGQNPTGVVSIVSDTYDFWNILTNYIQDRKEMILSRDGKVVFRPDSGHPVKIICGTHQDESPSGLGALELLWNVFGGTYNSKGYRVLNPKVGLIYGDGMFYDRFVEMLETMERQGWASSNLVIGVGGLLLQQHNRDDLGFAIKAVNVIQNGESTEIYKDPITDISKKSKKGFLQLNYDGERYTTADQCESHICEQLIPVFKDGSVLQEYSLNEVRAQLENTRKKQAVSV